MTDRTEILNRVKSCVERIGASEGGLEVGVTETSSFKEDLGLDSLDLVELVMELESEFKISINEDDTSSMKTVGNAVDYIVAHS